MKVAFENADVPDNIRFGTVEERILHMANVTASVGKLEIVSVACHLQRTIVILDEQFEPEEAVSGVQSNANKGRLTLQFQKLGLNIRHYNAVLVDSEHSNPSSGMATSSVHLAQSSFTVKAKDILSMHLALISYITCVCWTFFFQYNQMAKDATTPSYRGSDSSRYAKMINL